MDKIVTEDQKKLLTADLLTRQPGQNPQIEIEVKFKHYAYSFSEGVPSRVFYRVKKWLDGLRVPNFVLDITTYEQNVGNYNERHRIITSPQDLGYKQDHWIRKTQLAKEDNEIYYTRVTKSSELYVQPVQNFKLSFNSTKRRYSYYIYGGPTPYNQGDKFTDFGPWKLDLSVGTLTFSDGRTQPSYEIEAEIIDFKNAAEKWDQLVTDVLHHIYETEMLYKKSEYDTIVSEFNMLSGKVANKRPINKFDKDIIYNPRNLHYDDVVFGGLVGNPLTSYTVTYKADGIRKFLIFSKSGIWLIYPPYDATKLFGVNFDKFNGYVFDGELIPESQRKIGSPKQRYWFLVFDTISQPKTTVNSYFDPIIMDSPHKIRMAKAYGELNMINEQLLKSNMVVACKNFIEISGIPTLYSQEIYPNILFNVMDRMETGKKDCAYLTDGYIFTPAMMSYRSGNDKLRLSERKLTNYADICKWKPADSITIDMIWDPSNKKLMVDNNIPFAGTLNYPFDINVFDTKYFNDTVIPGAVTEFSFGISTENGENKIVPIRTRLDKEYPNNLDIAQDNWELINDPISIETLCGTTTRLMRKYHNRIKKYLVNEIQGEGKTLLDIGSGRGGDVLKWKLAKFQKIIAVEPNTDHVKELVSRIVHINLQSNPTIISNISQINLIKKSDTVIIINTGGENYDLIYKVMEAFVGGNVDYISLMLSLSFFWKSEEMLSGLVSTISKCLNPSGKVVFFTIDGDAVNELFDPKFKRGLAYNKIKTDSFEISISDITNPPDGKLKTFKFIGKDTTRPISEISWTPPCTFGKSGCPENTQLNINIEGTIVSEQTEWLVYIDQLRNLLIPHGLYLSKSFRADGELLLNMGEMIMSNLYTYGIFERNIKILKLEKESEISDQSDFPETMASPRVTSPILKRFQATPREISTSPRLPILTTIPSKTQPVGIPSVTIPRLPSPSPILPPITSPVMPVIPKLSEPVMPAVSSPILPPFISPSPTRIPSPRPILIPSPVASIPVGSQLPPPTAPPTLTQLPPLPPLSRVSPSIPKLPSPQRQILTSQPIPILPGQLPIPLLGLKMPMPRLLSPSVKTVQATQVIGIDPPEKIPDFKDTVSSYVGGLSDDDVQYVNTSWYNKKLVKIGTIGDGSCFFHSVLKSFYKPYAENRDINVRSYRMQVAQKFRSELATRLGQLSPDGKNTYYQIVNNGNYPSFAQHGKIQNIFGRTVDYSLSALQQLLNSSSWVGDEVFGYVAETLGLNIMVMIASATDLKPLISPTTTFNNTIIVSGNGSHFEVIGELLGNGLIQTVFGDNDPLMLVISAMRYGTFYYFPRRVYEKLAIVQRKMNDPSQMSKLDENNTEFKNLKALYTDLVNDWKSIITRISTIKQNPTAEILREINDLYTTGELKYSASGLS